MSALLSSNADLLLLFKIMKLTVAVGILSANSLPAVVAEAKSSDGQQFWAMSKKDHRVAIGSTRSNELGTRPSKGKFMMNVASWRSSSHGSTIHSTTECIPDESGEADVGALGCGSGQICVASVDSRLGGFCKSNAHLTGRRMQGEHLFDVCDPTSSYYQYGNYDCSSFDMATKTGSISYSREYPFCLGSMYYGCYNVCVSSATTFSFENGESISHDICAEIVASGNITTTTSSLCTYFSGDYETCETKLDGQKCTSCTTDNGLSFDCSNVIDGVKMELEEQTVWFANHPIIQACNKPVDGTYCDLCGVDFGMDIQNDTGTVISLDGFGDAFTCYGLRNANSYNNIPSDRCIEASAVAKAECCVDRWYVQ